MRWVRPHGCLYHAGMAAAAALGQNLAGDAPHPTSAVGGVGLNIKLVCLSPSQALQLEVVMRKGWGWAKIKSF